MLGNIIFRRNTAQHTQDNECLMAKYLQQIGVLLASIKYCEYKHELNS